MTDAEFAAVQARVREALDRWWEPLGLQGWRRRCTYYREEFLEREGEERTLIRVTVRWEYRDALLEVDARGAAELCAADLDQVVRHECAHILTMELKDYRKGPLGQKHAEAVATDLACAFLWVREAGQADILQGLVYNG